MAGVVVAFHRLQVVALHHELAHVDVVQRHLRPLELREGGLALRRSHVGPDKAAGLHARVGAGLDLVLERLALWRVRHVDAVARDVKLPAVVDAANAALFVPAKEQRCAPVRAVLVHQRGGAVGVAECDERFAQECHLYGVAVRSRKLICQQRRNPESAKYLAHRGASIDIGKQFVVILCQHIFQPPIFSRQTF